MIFQKTNLAIILFVAIAFFSPADLFAKGVVGTVTTVSGKVYVTEAGTEETLMIKTGTDSHFGDRYETKEKSGLKILFEDFSIISLGENSQIVIKSDVYDPEQNRRSRVIDIAVGSMRVSIGKGFSKGSKFAVHTPTAIAEAKGTYFMVWATTMNGKPVSGVLVLEGVVDVEPLAFNNEGGTLSVQPGQMILVGGGEEQSVAGEASHEVIAEQLAATEVPDQFDQAQSAVSESNESSENSSSFLSPDFLQKADSSDDQYPLEEITSDGIETPNSIPLTLPITLTIPIP